MDKLRMRFSKTGRAVWISHLDLMATMQRAFSRSGNRLQYSEGFNPRPLISIALPLSVGMSSSCELMDFRTAGEVDITNLPKALNAVLPEGIEVLEIYRPERKFIEIKWLDLEGIFEYDSGEVNIISKQLRSFFSRDTIVTEKKTKRGLAETDIRPAIRSLVFAPSGEGKIAVRALLSAQEPTLNPSLLQSALRSAGDVPAPDFAFFSRLETYDEKMQVFR